MRQHGIRDLFARNFVFQDEIFVGNFILAVQLDLGAARAGPFDIYLVRRGAQRLDRHTRVNREFE